MTVKRRRDRKTSFVRVRRNSFADISIYSSFVLFKLEGEGSESINPMSRRFTLIDKSSSRRPGILNSLLTFHVPRRLGLSSPSLYTVDRVTYKPSLSRLTSVDW